MATTGQEPIVSTEGQMPADNTDSETNLSITEGTQAEPKVYDETYVKQLRSEAAAHRAKLREFEKADADRKAAEMTELERTQARAKAAEERVTQMERNAAKRDALSALEKANVVDPDLAYLSLADKIAIEDGEPTNIAALIADFVKSRPQMVKQASAASALPETRITNPPATPTVPLRQRPPGRL